MTMKAMEPDLPTKSELISSEEAKTDNERPGLKEGVNSEQRPLLEVANFVYNTSAYALLILRLAIHQPAVGCEL